MLVIPDTMLYAGTDDGVYRADGVDVEESDWEHVLDVDRVMRVETFEGVEGLFAATESGLYRSPDGDEWTDLGVPRERVYAAGADPTRSRLYAGTFPAHVYVCDPLPTAGSGGAAASLDWRELDGFRELPSVDEWGTPRHDDAAGVRDLRTHVDAPDRLVAGVEVGGVHVSDDRGGDWTERRVEGFDAPHTDDVHELALEDGETVVAATGSGLYRTTDAGESWDRLDGTVDRRYFRGAFVHGGVVYAGAASGPSPTWDDDADHGLYESHDGDALVEVDSPRPGELAIGWTVVDGEVVAATHRGSLLAKRDGRWCVVGEVPVPGPLRGRYAPLAWVE